MSIHTRPANFSRQHRLAPTTQTATRRASALAIATLMLATTALLPAADADAQAGRKRQAPRVVNGVLTSAYPTAGALLHDPNRPIAPQRARSWCSGVMVGCQTFLTAAHCVNGQKATGKYMVFLQHAGFVKVESIVMHPSYSDSTFPFYDVAVVHLSEPVEGIRPARVNMSDPTVFTPLRGVVVGFGRSGPFDGGEDIGLKRAGKITTTSCPGINGAGDDELICWEFPFEGPPGEDSNTCQGDSGGPLFLDLGAGVVVGGLAAGGINFDCGPGDLAWDVSLDRYASFLLSEIGSDANNTACGDGPQVGDANASEFAFAGTLNKNVRKRFHTFDTGNSPGRIVVTLNGGEDTRKADFDLYLRHGKDPSTRSFDCKSGGASQYGVCEIENPEPGTWHVLVQRRSGTAVYQVTATVFDSTGGNNPVCGNGTQEFGEDCDGSDTGACPGACTSTCDCVAATCGDGNLDAGEQCDRFDDDACPGQCGDDCTCPIAAGCGDNSLDAGEQCDGGVDNACPGQCNNDCTCPATVCGDNALDAGEVCDGASDAACPGDCDANCTCMVSEDGCTQGDLRVTLLKTKQGKNFKFKFAAELDQNPLYQGLDPADPTGDGFRLALSSPTGFVSFHLPGDKGWGKSKKLRGQYRWAGRIDNVRQAKLLDRMHSLGRWVLNANGTHVPGIENIHPGIQPVQVRVTIDGVCAVATF